MTNEKYVQCSGSPEPQIILGTVQTTLRCFSALVGGGGPVVIHILWGVIAVRITGGIAATTESDRGPRRGQQTGSEKQGALTPCPTVIPHADQKANEKRAAHATR